ncbi:MAG: CBS domain-containing protein [SAR324 cluster bacterium]|nr:CBS domain-containing protein [SAR324 cluster bacterium]
MGRQDIEKFHDPEQHRLFMRHLLHEISAFETLLESGMIESDIRRIGAEQEVFIVDRSHRPYLRACEILEDINDPHFTTELAQFNLEFNLDPVVFEGRCLSTLEQEIYRLLGKARNIAAQYDAEIVLAGILPTICQADLDLSSITPKPRYFALNNAVTHLRGSSEYKLQLTGLDELHLKLNSVMAEACNSSFQLHFQVSAPEFAQYYNIAQAVTAPILAIAAYSPVLFGRRLWKETRIALFQNVVDTRSVGNQLRNRTHRASFGKKWVDDSILELLQENVAQFRVMISTELEKENLLEKIKQRIPPQFSALQLHNGTIYRWNRPCYGILNGKPHLRIENRVLPAGPTPLDEVANASLFFGALYGMASEYPRLTNIMKFDDAKANFFTAAQQGASSQMTWINRKIYPVQELILKEILPLAKEGLKKANIVSEDISRYLEVIEERVSQETNGAIWLLSSIMKFQKKTTPDQIMRSLVATSIKLEKERRPVHQWPLPELEDLGRWEKGSSHVEHIMFTDLYTVHPEELLSLVAKLVEWHHIRDIPVEDQLGELVGMVRYSTMLSYFLEHSTQSDKQLIPVQEIMEKTPFTVHPDTPTLEAIHSMIERKDTTIPVIKDQHLVGMLLDNGFSYILGQIFKEQLHGENQQQASPVFPDLKVEQLMNKECCVISPDLSVGLTAEQMVRESHSYVFLTNRRHELQGAVSYRIILRHVVDLPQPYSTPIEQIMKKDLITISPDASALSAIALMLKNQIGCLPVIEGNHLLGMLTEHDLGKMVHSLLIDTFA